MGIVFTPPITSYGLLSFIIFQSIVLSQRFAEAFTQVEELYDNLEQKVKERTFDLEQVKTEIETLNHFTYLVNSKSSLNDIFFEISIFMYAKHSIKGMWLFLPDEKQEYLYAYKAHSYDKIPQEHYDYLMNRKIPFNENGGMIYLTYKRKKSLYLPKIKKIEFEIDKEFVKTLSVRSFLYVPLVSKDVCQGILAFSNLSSEMILKKSEVNSITNLCSQIAGVIETTHLLQQVNKAKKETERLNELNKLVNSTTDLERILRFVYKYIEINIGLEIFWLTLVDQKTNELYTYDAIAPTGIYEKWDLNFFYDFRERLDKDLGALYSTYTKQIPFYILDTRKFQIANKKRVFKNQYNEELYSTNKKDFKIWLKLNLRLLVQIPLLLHGQTIGILNLSSYQDNFPISKEEVQTIVRLCENITGAVQNSLLLQQTETERKKSEKLLLNILPQKVAEELKMKGKVQPILHEFVSVLFTDFKGFTKVAESMNVEDLVKELDESFYYFDDVITKYHLEKIKTIGDSYMCAGGLPERNNTHQIDICLAALEIQSTINQAKELKSMMGLPYWELRLGIHVGPVIAGVVGKNKFAYDIWGDTVNTASRMESSGEIGKINISGDMYEQVNHFFECEYRGKVKAKNKGEIDMYFLHRLKKKYSQDEAGRMSNEKFREIYEIIKNGGRIQST
ncbi:MAG: hypothetical protein H7A23_25020 [Leptospiraceae bacterium]|nr:hypothetical protein [Leptospiraceae bacterium]MCP5497829.1 hypothetical protein [Leptospiraceae bacterium]